MTPANGVLVRHEHAVRAQRLANTLVQVEPPMVHGRAEQRPVEVLRVRAVERAVDGEEHGRERMPGLLPFVAVDERVLQALNGVVGPADGGSHVVRLRSSWEREGL